MHHSHLEKLYSITKKGVKHDESISLTTSINLKNPQWDMLSINFDILSKIDNLVKHLTVDNHKKKIPVIEQLIKMNGDDARLVFYTSLLDELGCGEIAKDQIDYQKVK